MFSLFLVILFSFIIFAAVHYFCKIKKPCKRALISLLCGPIVLLIVNLLSSVTGVLVPLSNLSLSVSVAGGIPGVALLVVMGILT